MGLCYNHPMSITVDPKKCIGCGTCVALAPKNFKMNQQNLAQVINQTITEDTKSAKDSCPVDAIKINQ